MDTLIHADVFFFVTTIAVIVGTVAFTVMFFYFIKVLKNVRDVSREIKEEAQLIREDIRMTRENVKKEGFKLKHIVSLFSRFSDKKTRSKKTK